MSFLNKMALFCLGFLVLVATTEGSLSLNKTTLSSLEKAEERRASLMQEILEEDLGNMKVRLIALEKKVEQLHPGGLQCNQKHIFPLVDIDVVGDFVFDVDVSF